ncbi:MAG: NifU family protein [Saprospiraceae bacterium]|nr:NifU family protein [Saprospiraceae bacterium]
MLAQEKAALINRINEALDDVRPHLMSDGGNIEVVDVTEDMTVMVRWLGNCQNCNMSLMTMKAGIEVAIKNKIPEVQHIEAVNPVEVG